jgi:hypothetical protein
MGTEEEENRRGGEASTEEGREGRHYLTWKLATHFKMEKGIAVSPLQPQCSVCACGTSSLFWAQPFSTSTRAFAALKMQNEGTERNEGGPAAVAHTRAKRAHLVTRKPPFFSFFRILYPVMWAASDVARQRKRSGG